jgi:hypothetical protein
VVAELPHATKHGVLNIHNSLCGLHCCRHLLTIVCILYCNIKKCKHMNHET